MGTALLLEKQSTEAELAFERALQLGPDSVAGETNAASAYLQAGDIDSPVSHLQRAVAMDPLHLPADLPLIDLYKRQGNVAKAAKRQGKRSHEQTFRNREGDFARQFAPDGRGGLQEHPGAQGCFL